MLKTKAELEFRNRTGNILVSEEPGISLSMTFPRDGRRLMGLYESTSVTDFPGFGIMIILADFQTFGKYSTVSTLLNNDTSNCKA